MSRPVLDASSAADLSLAPTVSSLTNAGSAPETGRLEPASPDDHDFLQYVPSRLVLLGSLALNITYLAVIGLAFQRGNLALFSLLVVTELFHLFQLVGYCHTVWSRDRVRPFDAGFAADVDVYITVCGEPADVVRRTVLGVLAMDYPGRVWVHLLNDGLVARKDDWRGIELLADELDVDCLTRTTPGGAKAGNINHALQRTLSPFVVVFDADHVPHRSFLREVMGYFTDERIGFVQTPQYYKNHQDNRVTRVAWQQQTLFFGPIMSGKSRMDAAFMCGTNMALRRRALEQVGGMCEENIAEDFLTSLLLHERGWGSVYVPKVLAEGLAPDDFLNYYKQQFRWARGSLEVIFKYNPLLRPGLSGAQQFQYLVSASYYLSGTVVLVDAVLPLVFLFTGQSPIITSTMTLALVFVPYIWINLAVLQRTSNATYTYQAIAFSLSSWWLHLSALAAVLTARRTSFSVTSKAVGTGGQANFLRLVVPQLAYIALAILACVVGLHREGPSPSLLVNVAWLAVHVGISVPFIVAAAPMRAPRRPQFIDLRTPGADADIPAASGVPALSVEGAR